MEYLFGLKFFTNFAHRITKKIEYEHICKFFGKLPVKKLTLSFVIIITFGVPTDHGNQSFHYVTH